MATLKARLDRLEERLQPSPFAGVEEFRFAEFSEPLAEGTVIPEGARVVEDFYEDFSCGDWARKPGVTFRSGYYRARLTTDPVDQGRIVPASEDPILQEYQQPAAETEAPAGCGEENAIDLPDDVAALYRE